MFLQPAYAEVVAGSLAHWPLLLPFWETLERHWQTLSHLDVTLHLLCISDCLPAASLDVILKANEHSTMLCGRMLSGSPGTLTSDWGNTW